LGKNVSFEKMEAHKKEKLLNNSSMMGNFPSGGHWVPKTNIVSWVIQRKYIKEDMKQRGHGDRKMLKYDKDSDRRRSRLILEEEDKTWGKGT